MPSREEDLEARLNNVRTDLASEKYKVLMASAIIEELIDGYNCAIDHDEEEHPGCIYCRARRWLKSVEK